MAPLNNAEGFIAVNEGNVGTKESVKFTPSGNALDKNLKDLLSTKVADLNKKLDDQLKNGFFDRTGENVTDDHKKRLQEFVRGLNEEIARLKDEYIGRTDTNKEEIQASLGKYFSQELFAKKSEVSVGGRRVEINSSGVKNRNDALAAIDNEYKN